MTRIAPFENPLFSVDSVLFTVHQHDLKVLVVKRAEAPFKGYWSLPGGYVDTAVDDDTDATARRKLLAKAGMNPQYLEQLQVISGAKRDPRGFSVTLVYYALVAHQDVAPSIASVEAARWMSVSEVASIDMAFDHRSIVEKARQRLKQKTLYSMTPVFCLPEYFTVAQLIAVIETIIEKPVQRKSLMRRIEASGMFDIAEDKATSGGRLAQRYRVKAGADLVNFERNLGG